MSEYLTSLAIDGNAGRPYGVSHIEQSAAAISRSRRGRRGAIDLSGDPAIRSAVSAVRAADRARKAPKAQDPLIRDDLIAMIDHARTSVTGWRDSLYERRDRAVLLIGWAGALGRTQLAGLTVGQVQRRKSGEWTIADVVDRDSVRDVELPKGQNVTTCPRCAYVRWMDVVAAYDLDSKIGLIRVLARPATDRGHVCASLPSSIGSNSPVFRLIKANQTIAAGAMGETTIHEIIARRAADAGLDPDRYGARSLRAGYIAEALSQGVPQEAVLEHVGQKKLPSAVGREERRSLSCAPVPALGL